MIPLALVEAAWTAARSPMIIWREVSSLEVNSLAIAWRHLRGVLVEDESMAGARSLGWRIFRTVTNTLHPFSEALLEISPLSDALGDATSSSYSDQFRAFEEAMRAVMSLDANPKAQCLEDIFCAAPSEESRILLFAAADAGRPLGFPPDARETLLSPYAGLVELVERVRDLDGRVADQLVLTSSPDVQRAPDNSWIYRILGRGRPEITQILHYAFERRGCVNLEAVESDDLVYLGDRRKETFVRSHQQPESGTNDQDPENEAQFPGEPDWQALLQDDGEEDFGGSPSGEAAHITFVNGRHVFIGLDLAVRRIGAEGKVEDVEVCALEGGDLVALRDGSSDDADLDKLASQALRANGRSYNAALASLKDWKAPLAAALARHGEEGLLRAVRSHGADIAPGRLRAWSGEDTLGPLRFKDFLALLRALQRCNLLKDVTDVPVFAAEHWGNVTALRNSRRRAGHELSMLLEQRLEDVMARGKVQSGSTIALDNKTDNEGLCFVILEVERVRVAPQLVPKSVWGHIRG